MAWDKYKPTDTTKIKDAPNVINNNFEAIEDADLTFIPKAIHIRERIAPDPLDPPSLQTPAAPYNGMIIFCKNDGSNRELYTMYSNGNIIKLTEGSNNGSITVGLSGSSIQFDSTLIYTQANMVTAAANVDSLGNGSGLFNCTTAKTSTGVYKITFDNLMSNLNYKIMAIPVVSSKYYIINFVSKALDNCILKTLRLETETLKDSGFDVVIFGGR